uniref:Cytochrome b5 heme-binding domain-containing protein n=1 Tax=Lepeophtheirus salmonis TaxID=72036 RepID=A0A0K2VHD0_LEPSM
MTPKVAKDEILVEGKIYSAENLAQSHPGGKLFVRAFAGLDASTAFLTYHRRKFPHSRAKNALKEDGEDSNNPEGWDEEYLELCRLVEKVIPRMKSFAPWYYYVKVAIILSMAVSIEYYMHKNVFYHPLLCGFLGYIFAVIGLNIQHDANHGAISRRPLVNRILGMSQNWIGGSAINWIHQHVVQHHIHTNDIDQDPDMDGGILIRINAKTPLMKFHIVQHIYFFFLLSFYGFSVVIRSLLNVIVGKHFTPMSSLFKKYRVIEVFSSVFFILRLMVFPIYQAPEIQTVLSLSLMFIVAGYYLSLFFAISHNFEGVEMNMKNAKSSSILRTQVATSSNVGGEILCFLNGGLNYQIEHHLFPRISHCHYPKIAPVVRQFCEERNIPYVHFPSVLDNINSAIKHLVFMGGNAEPFPELNTHILASKLQS